MPPDAGCEHPGDPEQVHDDQGRRVGAVANAVVVLLLGVLALGSSGAEVDHAEVRPWGCRTCPIPAQTPGDGPVDGSQGGAGSREDASSGEL
jgi:hypothetical protein